MLVKNMKVGQWYWSNQKISIYEYIGNLRGKYIYSKQEMEFPVPNFCYRDYDERDVLTEQETNEIKAKLL